MHAPEESVAIVDPFDLADADDAALLRDAEALTAQGPIDDALLLAHIAEIDARRLYLSAGFPSMLAYCVMRLGLTPLRAMRRIRAAQVAAEFPRIYEGVARGRLGLGAIMLLARHLTDENADDLIADAECMPKYDLSGFLACVFREDDDS